MTKAPLILGCKHKLPNEIRDIVNDKLISVLVYVIELNTKYTVSFTEHVERYGII